MIRNAVNDFRQSHYPLTQVQTIYGAELLVSLSLVVLVVSLSLVVLDSLRTFSEKFFSQDAKQSTSSPPPTGVGDNEGVLMK